MAHDTIHTPLHRYIEVDPDYYAAYESYQPEVAVLEQIREIQPEAHVITPSRYSCSDCARNLPRMARIAEHLPGWTWEVFDSASNAERKQALGIIRIPTFIVYDRNGKEVGRIIENPVTGWLERDLLRIVQGSA